MKTVASLFFIFLFLQAEAQLEKVDWASAKIDLGDTIIMGMVALDNSFFEGTLLVKDGERISALPPQKVKKFTVLSLNREPLKFVSIETKFTKKPGPKPAFLLLNHKGETYSLYSKFLPDKKRSGLILPIGGWGLAWGVFTIILNEGVLFISQGQQAYQVSIPKELDEGFFKIDKKKFYELMGDRAEKVKSYMKRSKKKLFLKDDLIDILKFADSI